jgi:hypothetical protein
MSVSTAVRGREGVGARVVESAPHLRVVGRFGIGGHGLVNDYRIFVDLAPRFVD